MGSVHHVTAYHDGFPKFEVEYEVVPAPLPDLQVTEIRVGALTDNQEDNLCVVVRNAGPWAVGKRTTHVFMDGAIVKNGIRTQEEALVGGVPRHDTQEDCFTTSIPDGQHTFRAVVDPDKLIPESNELNNTFAVPLTVSRRAMPGREPIANPIVGVLDPGLNAGAADATPTPTVPAATPTATPPAILSQADLVPSEIRVNGKQPTGHNDCDPGRNEVTVQIKNQGGANAGEFGVALLVNGTQGDGNKKTVQSLAKGQQTSVRFDDVKLDKGTNQLTVKVDADSRIAESDETNNLLEISASCKN